MILINKCCLNSRAKGESLFSVLVALMLFAFIFLSFFQWESHQQRLVAKIYQERQMVQLADNQKARLALGLECEKEGGENGIRFSIQCSQQEVIIRGSMATLIFH